MKRSLSLVLALIFCLLCSTAFAAGLSGLGSGGLSGLSLGGSSDALPDPAEVTEETGSLLQADYAFSGDYLCDAYLYPRPDNTADFIDQYTVVCRKAGYTLNETTVDGARGYSIQSGDGKYALLVPNYEGQMLFLVQKGMTFTPQTRTNYATFTYNNRDYEAEVYFTSEWAFYNAFGVTFKVERAPFETLTIYFPQYARSGDEFYVGKSDFIEGFEISMDHDRWLLNSLQPFYGGRDDDIESSRDYAQLVLHTVKDTDDGILVEGTFNGSFRSGDVVFEDFVFSAIIDP